MKAAFFRRSPRRGWLGLAAVLMAAGLAVGTTTASSASTTTPQDGHHETIVQPERAHDGVQPGGHREADAQSDLTLAKAAGWDTDTDATPRATCNYRVWWGAGVNIHTEKDRESRIVYHLNQDTVLYGQTCSNSTGGNYGSCQPSNQWKAVTYGTAAGWVATKCLQRV